MTNYEGKIKREKMLAAFSNMIKPARIITNFSQEELAEKSGLPLEFIAGVENGINRFCDAHYLALAAIFDNVKYTEDSSIYRAVLRILTPEDDMITDKDSNDFVLVRRWLDSFDNCESESGAYDEIINNDNLLEDLAENYEIYIDISAAEDDNFPAFLSRLEPLLRQNDSKILVPSTVISELEEDIEISNNEREKLDLTEALDYIKTKSSEGLIKICECLEVFEDTSEVLHAILRDAQEYENIAVITQESDFANNLESDRPNVIAARINDTGDLILWR